jgi:hypothetical protein
MNKNKNKDNSCQQVTTSDTSAGVGPTAATALGGRAVMVMVCWMDGMMMDHTQRRQQR